MIISHRARALVMALTCSILIAGCSSSSSSSRSSSNNSSGNGGSNGGSTSTTTNPPAGCSNPGNDFGVVCNVSWPANVGTNNSPGDGTAIHKGDPIGTGPNGQMEFWISVKIRKCTIFPMFSSGTNLTVWPTPGAPQVILHLEQGAAACKTNNYPHHVDLSVGNHVRIHMADPVFVAMIDPSGTVLIQVFVGTLTVSTDTGQSSVTLTAGTAHAQVLVDPSGKIQVPTALAFSKLPKAELVAIRDVQD